MTSLATTGPAVTHVTQFMRKPASAAYSMETVYADVRANLPDDIVARVQHCSFESRGIVNRLCDAWAARRHQGDVNHITGDVHYLAYFLKPARTVITMHDCIGLDRTKGLKHWLLWLFWYWLPGRRCRLIVTVSNAAKERLLAYLRCPADKIRVIHNPVGAEYRPSPKAFDDQRPKILFVGTMENKNLDRMAEALAGISCEAVILGQMSARQVAAFQLAGVSFTTRFNLPREGVVSCYQECDFLAFASAYEGFGLPIIEAQAVGRPVVTSNLHSMPEVAGGAACLVDPFDVASIREGFLKVIRDREYCDALVQRGFVNARRFSVRDVAARYAAIYREVAA